MSTSASTSNVNKQSSEDKQLSSYLAFKKISARLSNISTKLTELPSLLSNLSMSQYQKASALSSLKQTIIPFITDAFVRISASSKAFAPHCQKKIMFITKMKLNRRVCQNQTKVIRNTGRAHLQNEYNMLSAAKLHFSQFPKKSFALLRRSLLQKNHH